MKPKKSTAAGLGLRKHLGTAALAVSAIMIAAGSSFEANAQQAQEPMRVTYEGRDIGTRKMVFGAELGSSIDVSGYDTSTFDAELTLGYRNRLIRTLGIATGVQRSFGNRNTFIPICLVFDSSFRSKPSPFFLHLKGGYSFNTIDHSTTFGNTCGCIGLGLNLAMTRKMMSHIIIGYAFRHFDHKHEMPGARSTENVSLAQLAFGVTF